MREHLLSLLDRREYFELLIERGLKVLIIIAVVVACAKLLGMVRGRILAAARAAGGGGPRTSDQEKRLTTVVSLLNTILKVAMILGAGLMILHELGFNIAPILTGAGVAGVAVGFGAQGLVKDIIAGFFLLVEDQIRVGDVIKINSSLGGSVERMHLRVTAIRDGDGTLHIIPNGQITSVSNMTYGFGNASIEVPVSYSNDVGAVVKAITSALDSLAADPAFKDALLDKPSFSGITKLQPDQMMFEASVKTKPHQRWAVETDLRQRVRQSFAAAGIDSGRSLAVISRQKD